MLVVKKTSKGYLYKSNENKKVRFKGQGQAFSEILVQTETNQIEEVE